MKVRGSYVTRAHTRGKNLDLREEYPDKSDRSQSSEVRLISNQPSPTAAEPKTRPGEGLFDAEPRVQDLLMVWGEVEPFSMLGDREGMARVLTAAYPRVDLEQESRKIIAWWFANPSKRKTRRGVKRFLNAWFSRASTGSSHPGFAKKKREVSYSAADLWGDDER